MGLIHEVEGAVFGLEERRESFVILWGGDCEEHGVFVYYDEGISGGIELTFDRLSELRDLLQHPSIQAALEGRSPAYHRQRKRIQRPGPTTPGPAR